MMNKKMVSHKCNKEKEITEIQSDIKYIREKLEIISTELKENTKFRYQATGTISTISFIAGGLGAIIFWVADKIWK